MRFALPLALLLAYGVCADEGALREKSLRECQAQVEGVFRLDGWQVRSRETGKAVAAEDLEPFARDLITLWKAERLTFDLLRVDQDWEKAKVDSRTLGRLRQQRLRLADRLEKYAADFFRIHAERFPPHEAATYLKRLRDSHAPLR